MHISGICIYLAVAIGLACLHQCHGSTLHIRQTASMPLQQVQCQALCMQFTYRRSHTDVGANTHSSAFDDLRCYIPCTCKPHCYSASWPFHAHSLTPQLSVHFISSVPSVPLLSVYPSPGGAISPHVLTSSLSCCCHHTQGLVAMILIYIPLPPPPPHTHTLRQC